MIFYVIFHLIHGITEIFRVCLFEVVDQLSHFLVVESTDDSFKILLKSNFRLIFCYSSLISTKNIDLDEIDQIDFVEWHRNVKFALIA